MQLVGLIRRRMPPEPWAEGDNIPWHDPEFSRRMLREHLSQEHDAASRRLEAIERQIHWIHHRVLGGRLTRILDLGCGPGLYTGRFARLGHECVGIDYSPASIEYAREEAQREGLRCTYRLEDVRTADYGSGFDLLMLIYGEFNVFKPTDAGLILTKAHRALAPVGLLLLEPHTFAAVRAMGDRSPTWYATESGLFAAEPHLCLEESHWDEATCTATNRYYVVDAATGTVAQYGQTVQAYTDEEYRSLLERHGFAQVEFCPSLQGPGSVPRDGLLAIVARKALLG